MSRLAECSVGLPVGVVALGESPVPLGLVGVSPTTFSVARALARYGVATLVGVWVPEGAGAGLTDLKLWSDLEDLAREAAGGVLMVAEERLLGPLAQLQLHREGTVIIHGPLVTLLERLVRDHELYVTILETMQEGVQFADAGGVIRYVNTAFTAITGIPPEERIGKNVFEVSPKGALAQVLRTGQPVFGVRNTVAGTGIEVVSNASPVVADGKAVGAVTVFQDVTKVARLQEVLQEKEKVITTLSVAVRRSHQSWYTFDDIIGGSAAIRNVVAIARRLAQGDLPVLIQGETGTGKEVLAGAIHSASPRRNGPFVVVNCAAIPEHLIESEMFGYAKGAFTGADHDKPGLFEIANGGTVFLDEIGELPPGAQAKLLRVLETGEYQALGSVRPRRSDVRVIAATNRDLWAESQKGSFRVDLFWRLSAATIHIPPLRERREDIPALVDHFIARCNKRLGKNVRGVSDEVMQAFMSYRWPGNVRELVNVLERAMLLEDGPVITAASLRSDLGGFFWDSQARVCPATAQSGVDAGSPSPDGRPWETLNLRDLERLALERAISAFGNNTRGKREAARALGISLATLYSKLRRHGLYMPGKVSNHKNSSF